MSKASRGLIPTAFAVSFRLIAPKRSIKYSHRRDVALARRPCGIALPQAKLNTNAVHNAGSYIKPR
ncbi:hypothetical protein I4J42_13175, partial [Corynebacterium belfantii]|uniref:hypothetical protein n=1 Tax=Corynebacterium belfantii TaxID=2014537 RepID=UPI001A2F2C83|nr:hypothetical protein [Corynebacterium belfantii]MBG9334681.1 hypothetical protein [Corynebacterium belfantii]